MFASGMGGGELCICNFVFWKCAKEDNGDGIPILDVFSALPIRFITDSLCIHVTSVVTESLSHWSPGTSLPIDYLIHPSQLKIYNLPSCTILKTQRQKCNFKCFCNYIVFLLQG